METGKITHCISIREPYVSMIVAGLKTLEWRSRKLIARPPETIAVATSKAGAGDLLPGGHIVGIARISAVVPFREARDFYERAGAPDSYGERWGGYAMMIGGFAACEPVPVRGNVGVYKTPEGFSPVYADAPDALRGWWGECKCWKDGPQMEGDEELMQAMLERGIGWRVDD